MGKLTPESRIRLSSGQVSSRLGDEVVILDLTSNEYLGLENIGARVWELLAEPTSVKAIEQAIATEYEISSEDASSDVRAFLEALIERGLVVVNDPGA